MSGQYFCCFWERSSWKGEQVQGGDSLRASINKQMDGGIGFILGQRADCEKEKRNSERNGVGDTLRHLDR